MRKIYLKNVNLESHAMTTAFKPWIAHVADVARLGSSQLMEDRPAAYELCSAARPHVSSCSPCGTKRNSTEPEKQRMSAFEPTTTLSIRHNIPRAPSPPQLKEGSQPYGTRDWTEPASLTLGFLSTGNCTAEPIEVLSYPVSRTQCRMCVDNRIIVQQFSVCVKPSKT